MGGKRITQKIAEERVLNRCKKSSFTLFEPFIYADNEIRIHIKCNICDYDWYPVYKNFVNGHRGCEKCGGSLPTTQKEAENLINEICIKNNYTLTKPFIYENNKTRIFLQCNNDENKWNSSYVKLKLGRRCKKCAKLSKPTHEELNEKILNTCVRKKCKLIESFTYINSCSKLHLECCICGYNKWKPAYSSFVNSETGCLKCGGRLTITQEEAEKNINIYCIKNDYILLKSFLYKNDKTRIFLMCNKDSNKWNISYNQLVHKNNHCPECGKKFKKSENKIKKLLENNNIEYVRQYRNSDWLGRQSLDFYLPKYNIAIEYQGLQHFKEIKLFGGDDGLINMKRLDLEKYSKCKIHEINILYFTYHKEKEIPTNYFAKVYTEEKELIDEIKRLINFKSYL